jgi:hypothetical protein
MRQGLELRQAGRDVALDRPRALQRVLPDALDGSVPWRPDSITQYFARLRSRVKLDHLDFHYLRKFMETYGQNLGYSNEEDRAKSFVGLIHMAMVCDLTRVASLQLSLLPRPRACSRRSPPARFIHSIGLRRARRSWCHRKALNLSSVPSPR